MAEGFDSSDVRETGPSPLVARSHEEEEMDERQNKNSDQEPDRRALDADEDWDLGSPLLPHSARRSGSTFNNNNNRNLTRSLLHETQTYPYAHEQRGNDSYTSFDDVMAQEENLAAASAAASMDPYHFYYTICTSSMCMLFICLVVGSFFFPWSDTMIQVSFDTIMGKDNDDDSDDGGDESKIHTLVGDKIEFRLPLYTNVMFQSALAAFRSSDAMFTARALLLFAVIVPAMYMVVQCVLVAVCYLMGPPSSPSLRLQWDGRDPVKARLKWLQSGLWMKSPLCILKFSMSVVYVAAILSVCMSNVIFALGGDYSPGSGADINDSSDQGITEATIREIEKAKEAGLYLIARIVSEARGGIISYLLGILFGTGSFMILKAQLSRGLIGTAKSCVSGDLEEKSGISNENQEEESEKTSAEEDIFRSSASSLSQKSPPLAAFRIGNSCHDNGENDDNEEEMPNHVNSDGMNGLDGLGVNIEDTRDDDDDDCDENDLTGPLLPQSTDETGTFDAAVAASDATDENQHMPVTRRSLTWSEILLFEASLFSFLLYIPVLVAKAPVIELKYSGVLTPVLDKSAFDAYELTGAETGPVASSSLTFFTLIWKIATNNGGPRASALFPIITSMILWTNVILIPTISWFCCSISFIMSMMSRYSVTWRSTVVSRRSIMAIPKLLHPMSHMTPFVMSLLVSVSSLGDLSLYLFNHNLFCEKVTEFAGMLGDEKNPCLQILGNAQPLMYILLLQSLAMDIYIIAL